MGIYRTYEVGDILKEKSSENYYLVCRVDDSYALVEPISGNSDFSRAIRVSKKMLDADTVKVA